MLTTQNLSLFFDGKPLFEDVSINFLDGFCYGVIGANGAGKSTFLKLLSGDIESTKGSVHLQPNKRLSFLRQDHFQYDSYTVLETVIMGNAELYAIMQEKEALYSKEDFTEADGLRAGELEERFADMDGWNAEVEASMLLNGLGISDSEIHSAKMGSLPGNLKVKVLLAQAVFGHPDVLLLDEPTNHLDIEAVRWLEEYVINLESTVIIVSHDRHFLNKTCTHIADIDYGKIQLYVGNYDFWYESSQLIQKQMRDNNARKEEKMKELQDFIDRFSANASKSKQATSRKQALQKIELDELKASNRRHPFIDFKPNRPLGQSVLTLDHVRLSADDGLLTTDISTSLANTDKVALLGDQELLNTRFLETLADSRNSNWWGSTVQIGYFPKSFDQEFSSDISIVQWLSRYSDDKDESFVRGFLGRMLFSGEDALKSVKVLSGGEKVRCMLSKLMIMGANVLIFDDPTNHLDMESIMALNNALIRFTGTLIFTSHDYEIISTSANRFFEFDVTGHLIDYQGTYEEYLDHRQQWVQG